MVFFTCNHCGESVKKPAVEKHYSFKCRGAQKSVSCMDCQKDFYGQDYAQHTQCITEAEKYSGKDYVPKESKNSGQKKQESWMDIIRSILNTKEYNLSGATKAAFHKIQNLDNVPRKKAKFINFASAGVLRTEKQAMEVWDILEKELEKMKAIKAAEVAAAKLEAAKPEVKAVEEKPAEKPDDEVGTTHVKKSKSKKRKAEDEIKDVSEQTEIPEDAPKEPKKKKSNKTDSTDAAEEQPAAEQEPTISTTTPDEEFQWTAVFRSTVQKRGNSMKMDKLKKKIQKMYLSRREMTEFTPKQQTKFDKKFKKYLKISNLRVEDDIVKVD